MGQFGITLKKTYQDVKVTLAEGAKFRVIPKPEFDDKGRVKPLKPNPKDPDRNWGGVKGSAEDLSKDMWVVVNLSRLYSRSKHVAAMVVVLGKEEEK